MNTKRNLSGLFALASLCAAGPVRAQTTAFTHPGVPFTAEDLKQLKANAKVEPWLTGYRALAADSHSSLDYKMQGPRQKVTRSPHYNRSPWINDMQAVHNLTFMWVFTGNDAYARKATDILNAWAVTNTEWGGDEALFDLGDWAHCYTTAADLLRANYSGWTAENAANVKRYFEDVIWPQLDVPNPVRGANQGGLALRAAVGIAAYLGDETKWKQAIHALRTDPAGGLANGLANGQIGDFGRDEGHSAGQLWSLTWCAEVAWKQGIDVYADFDNRLLKASELSARKNLEPGSVPFTPFGNPYGYYTNWGWDNPARRPVTTYNMIESAYGLRKNLPLPFTRRLRDEMKETKDTFLFRKTQDGSKATPMPAVVEPPASAIDELTDADIGGVTPAGSTRSQSGVRTIESGGRIAVPAGVNDAFRFNYRKTTGDFTAIAKVTSVRGDKAVAGLMVRGSLAPDAKFVGVLLTQSQGVYSTWRDAVAFCKTDMSWDIKTQTPLNYEVHNGPTPEWWLKVVRIGTRVMLYHSQDAQNWTCAENVETSIPDECFVGLCVSSNDPAATATATFSGVAMTAKQ